MLYLLFFCSGLSGLIYQIVWVREFGNVFGNTVYSAALVVAIFMLGLGAGSYLVGVWSDQRYGRAPDSLLRVYGAAELAIAALGISISLVLPHLGAISAASSSYVADGRGWFVLSSASYLIRGGIAIVLLTPITVLMGGTLTLLVRHLVRGDVEETGGWQIALLYAVNTGGAAAGAFLTDFFLVPSAGLMSTQFAAAGANIAAGCGALWLAGIQSTRPRESDNRKRVRLERSRHLRRASLQASAVRSAKASRYNGIEDGPRADARDSQNAGALVAASVALALTGFAAMGMEIVWFRHFTVLLGGFRAVFSLLLTVILAGIGAGALAGGAIDRRTMRPGDWLIAIEAIFVVFVFVGLGNARAPDTGALAAQAAAGRSASELWLNLRAMIAEVGIPSLMMGFSFPLANAMVQHAERTVGRSAGALYLANTLGAVAGSIAAGFILVPALGMQVSAAILMAAAALSAVPVYLASPGARRGHLPFGGSLLASGAAIGVWLMLPTDHVIARATMPPPAGERLLTRSEGLDEIIAVTEVPGRGRGLITNGHPMSSTAWLDQRYMRALAHIPLLSMDAPARALVIGFGAGNTTHAATLHPSVKRVDVADLSRGILEHAGYFRDANGGVLQDSRVAVYVNDGRQHLQMQPHGFYDLITLEPPPITHAGVASLYSREFYALARTRLTKGGYLGQWLPAYQVPPETSLAMVRAFVDVFPQAVLLSGMQAELLLLGTTADRIEIDPGRLARALERAPEARADLQRLDLGTVTQIVGTFVGSADTLARATRASLPVSDDRPLQEYSVRSVFGSEVRGVPAALADVSAVAAWCPRCYLGGRPAEEAPGLDTYLALLDQAYHQSAAGPVLEAGRGRRVLGSAYLGAIVPDSDAAHNTIGVALLREGRYGEAEDAFREALRRRTDSVDANRNLGIALAARGRPGEAIDYLRRAVRLDATDAGAQHELGTLLLERHDFAQAADHLRAALTAMPGSAAAHNDLGIALASMGKMTDAIEQFEQASKLDPGFEEARRNLASAVRMRGSL